MFHEHEDLRVETTRADDPGPARTRRRVRRAAVELAAVTAMAWVAAIVLYDPIDEVWTEHDHLWLAPLLCVLALAGSRVRARLGRSRSERTVVFDATGAVLIGTALLVPPLAFPFVAAASAWRARS